MSPLSNPDHLRSLHCPILPSLLLCDFGNLEAEVRRLEQAGVEALHLDVMDGRFVPNLTYGLPIVEALRRLTSLVLDAHLMIVEPDTLVDRFVEAGADVVTIHVEAVDEPRPVLERIRSLGAKAGLALNPTTPVARIESVLDACDLVLVMSVEPGFGGQAFDPVALEKLTRLRSLVPDTTVLEVDGGVNQATVESCFDAGADQFVVGSAIFRNNDYAAAVSELQTLAQASRSVRERPC